MFDGSRSKMMRGHNRRKENLTRTHVQQLIFIPRLSVMQMALFLTNLQVVESQSLKRCYLDLTPFRMQTDHPREKKKANKDR